MINNLRFMSQEQYCELVNLFHLARTALSDKPLSEQTKYYRMLWATKEFNKLHPEISATAAYKDLSANMTY